MQLLQLCFAQKEMNVRYYFLGCVPAMAGAVYERDIQFLDGIKERAIEFLETILYYLPFVGIGIFIVGVMIALFSLINKSNQRWGIRMAVVTSIGLYVSYILIAIVYDNLYMEVYNAMPVRPEQTDYYGEIYFNAYEKVLAYERAIGIADTGLSENVLELLKHYFISEAFNVGVVSTGMGLLLIVVACKATRLKRWALFGLCIFLPVILYVGYWFISRMA